MFYNKNLKWLSHKSVQVEDLLHIENCAILRISSFFFFFFFELSWDPEALILNSKTINPGSKVILWIGINSSNDFDL
jgi:hypothetical protein